MATNTDAIWTERLNSANPDFLANFSNEFQATANEIITNAINKIGKTLVTPAADVANPFNFADKGSMDYGDTLEMLGCGFVTPYEYDPESTTPFALSKPTATVEYFKINTEKQYSLTIWDRPLKKMFNSAGNYGAFVSALLDSLTKSVSLDAYTEFRKFCANKGIAVVNNDLTYESGGTVDDIDAGDVLSKIREYVNVKMREPSDDYNIKGIMTVSTRLKVILPRKWYKAIEDKYSNIFHPDRLGIDADIVLIDDFATPADTGYTSGEIIAFICDADYFGRMISDITTESQRNSKGKYNNYFLTVGALYYADLCKNAVKLIATEQAD